MSDLDLSKAVTDLQWLSNRLSGVLSLKDNLDDWNTMQQKVNELKTAEQNLKDSIAQQQDKLDKASEEHSQQLKDNQSLVSDANAQVKGILSDAKAKAASIIQDANDKVKGILDNSTKQQSDLDVVIEAKKTFLSELSQQISSADKKLSDLNSALAGLKSKF